MTTWVEDARGGRERGVRGLLRAWLEVTVRPRRFFRVGVAPGDQAPGLVFADAVACWFVVGLFAFAPGAIPAFGGGGAASAALALLATALIVAPATLHLLAALQTVFLMAAVEDRAGVSETVQAIAYAAAPCALAGPPIPSLRAACACYGAVLLAVGIGEVHGASLGRATLVSALPSALLFGYGFRGFDAVATLLSRWYII